MAKFKTYVSVTQEAIISSDKVADIIEKEIQKVLGNSGVKRWIENGWVMERDRLGKEEIRKVTDEEKRKYDALIMAREHFKSLG